MTLLVQAVDSSLPSPGDADYQRSQNIRVLNELKEELGTSVAKEVWHSVASEYRESFSKGAMDLTPHVEKLRAQGHNLLLNNVKEGNPHINNSFFEPQKITEWLNSHSNESLRNFIEDPELLYQSLHSLEREASIQIIYENQKLFNHIRNVYSSEKVDQALQLIPASERKLIDEGKLTLSNFIPMIKEGCEKLSKKSNEIGELPEGEELEAFLETAQVTKYVSGSEGAFFLTGTHKGASLTIVAKAANKPAQEFFANALYSQLDINVPKTQVMGKTHNKKAAIKLKKVLEKSPQFKEKYSNKCPTMFLVMSCISGTTLENWKDSDILNDKTSGPSDLVYDQVLVNMGEIAAADFLLYYRDRFPTIGMGNLANLMIYSDEQGKNIKAVAIDQVAALSQDFKKFDLMQIDPLERIPEIVTRMMKNPSEISAEARAIFENIPESVKGQLNEKKALEAIQKGMNIGLSKIAMLGTPELLDQLHQKLPKASNARDFVDLNMHKQMLEKLKEAVLQ